MSSEYRAFRKKLGNRLRELIVPELVREGRISSGKGAEITEMTKPDFISLMGRNHIACFTETPDELADQVEMMENLLTIHRAFYDAAGNITAEEVMPEPGFFSIAQVGMSYTHANRLAVYNGETIRHDADGNMIRGRLNRDMADFEFDSRNRLTRGNDRLRIQC
ncbi:UPF0175 family protein [Desulfococcaceae bacterium HSG8]|nr:UPF0175 family protein [Desulfococcaceae bacterium HSG8]